MLRMPKPLRALDPRMEMPRSRGPLPCLKETPGLSCSSTQRQSICEMPRYHAVLSDIRLFDAQRPTRWLGREDSNLCIRNLCPAGFTGVVPCGEGRSCTRLLRVRAHDLLPLFAPHDSGSPKLRGAMALYLARYLNVPAAASPAMAATSSTICPPMSRRSEPLCSMPSTGSGRSMSRRVSWHAVSHSATCRGRLSPRWGAGARGRGLSRLSDIGGWGPSVRRNGARAARRADADVPAALLGRGHGPLSSTMLPSQRCARIRHPNLDNWSRWL